MRAQCVPSLNEMDQEILSKSRWYLSEGSNQGLPQHEADETHVYSNDLKTCLDTLPIQLQSSMCNHYAFPSSAVHTILFPPPLYSTVGRKSIKPPLKPRY